jgi:hypothetical protein
VAARKPAAQAQPVVARKPVATAPIQHAAVPGKSPTAPAHTGPVSPEVAIQHFREVLRAKLERESQGPSYPSANPFSGRIDSATATQHADTEGQPPPAAGTPEPEALTGSNSIHGRGNQGMRNPK